MNLRTKLFLGGLPEFQNPNSKFQINFKNLNFKFNPLDLI